MVNAMSSFDVVGSVITLNRDLANRSDLWEQRMSLMALS